MVSLQVQKLEADVHIKAPAKLFYDVLCSRTHHLANICPEIVQSVEIHEGEWGSRGSIIFWNCVLDSLLVLTGIKRHNSTSEGKKCVAKELVELVDTENKITFKVLEGDLMEYYKSFRFLMEVLPQVKGSVVHWTFEYEKLNDHIPDPHTLLQLEINLTKDVDAHLVAQQEEATTK